MAYKRTTWVNNETKLNAQNLNNMEDGIVEAKDAAANANASAISANERANQALQETASNKTGIDNLTTAFNNFIITFVGTREEYEAANKAGQIPSGILVVITDEEEEIPNSSATTAVLGTATLGSMILGQA